MIKETQDMILKLKSKNDAAILAHSYQSLAIQEIADITGDSFKIATMAKDLKQNNIYMCGVRFMAEAIKLLSPQKRVILVNPDAGCPMAEQIDPKKIVDYKKKNPSHTVVAYINTTAEIKAVSDVCVTSSSATEIVNSIKSEDILFIPDKNLGGYVAGQVKEKRFHFLDGCCPIHNSVTVDETLNMKEKYKGYKLLCHPELPVEVCELADFVGSTAGILKYAREHKDYNCIIGTEITISHILQDEFNDRDFPVLSKKLICPDMTITSINNLYSALQGVGGEEVKIDDKLLVDARNPILKMIELSKN